MNEKNIIKEQIEKLKEKIKYYEYEYYVLDNPSITDYEYDLYLKELIELENKYPEFKSYDSPTNKVGGHVSEKFSKIKHDIPMMSLGNAFDSQDLIKFDADIKKAINSKDVTYVVEPKIDGLSISVKYKNGKYYQAVTRGDGSIGEDVTENVRTIKNIPLIVNYEKDFEIRGEVFLYKKDFEKINSSNDLQKKFANSRNAASGSLRNLDTKITASRNLSAFFYFVPNAELLSIHNQYSLIEWLKQQGIPTNNDIKHCLDIDEVLSYVEHLTKIRNELKFDIDGIVIKLNEYKYYEEIGYTSKFPKWAIAYKFPANVKESKLLSIFVNVGRTGRINYVANIEPILLDGSIISKATLHNAEYIAEKDIKINDVIEIYKAGDVIPKIIRPILSKRTGNEKEFIAPTNCPSCKSELIKFEGEVDLYCTNENCKEKIIQQISHFCSRDGMNIEGLSEMIVRKLYDNNLLADYTDLYDLEFKKEEIISKDLLIKEKMFNNLILAINNSKKNSMEKLLFALGIKHVGFTVAKNVSKRFKNFEELSLATIEEIESIGDIGIKIAQSIYDWFNNDINLQRLGKLRNKNINMKYINEYADIAVSLENEKYMNKTYVITGSFSQNRNFIKNILESVYNSKTTSSVTKKTNYLLCGSNPTNSKIEKAKELGIEIIDIEFWNKK